MHRMSSINRKYIKWLIFFCENIKVTICFSQSQKIILLKNNNPSERWAWVRTHKCSTRVVGSQITLRRFLHVWKLGTNPCRFWFSRWDARPGHHSVDGLSPGDSAQAVPASPGVGDHRPGASHVSAPRTRHVPRPFQRCLVTQSVPGVFSSFTVFGGKRRVGMSYLIPLPGWEESICSLWLQHFSSLAGPEKSMGGRVGGRDLTSVSKMKNTPFSLPPPPKISCFYLTMMEKKGGKWKSPGLGALSISLEVP